MKPVLEWRCMKCHQHGQEPLEIPEDRVPDGPEARAILLAAVLLARATHRTHSPECDGALQLRWNLV